MIKDNLQYGASTATLSRVLWSVHTVLFPIHPEGVYLALVVIDNLSDGNVSHLVTLKYDK